MTTLGTFWDHVSDKAVISAYLLAKQQTELQTHEDINNLMKCASRHETPIHTTKLITPLVIHKSEYETNSIKLLDNLVSANVITDAIVNPSIVWLTGYDHTYDLATKTLTFDVNPFTVETINKTAVKDENGQVIDQSITLWLNESKYDEEYVYKFWGNLLNLYAESSEEYRALISLILDSLLFGTTVELLEKILCLYYDAPLAEGDEIVEDIVKADIETILVITDKYVYRCKSCNVLLVRRGEVLSHNQPLTNRCLLLHPSQIPYNKLVPEVTLPSSLFNCNIADCLTFHNNDEQLFTVDGKKRFTIIGKEEDVNLFWAAFYKNGGSLDQYTNDTINPCSFVFDNYIKHNFLICITDTVLHACDKLADMDIKDIFKHIIMPTAGIIITSTTYTTALRAANG